MNPLKNGATMVNASETAGASMVNASEIAGARPSMVFGVKTSSVSEGRFLLFSFDAIKALDLVPAFVLRRTWFCSVSGCDFWVSSTQGWAILRYY